MRQVIVIGGGAAGLMAAIQAAQQGARVTLLERNEKPGKKIYITGKGRCNVTNCCEADAFRKNVVKNPRFLFSALNTFPPKAMMEWLENNGCPIVVERGDRVFPASEKASDITKALESACRRNGVKIYLNSRVRNLLIENSVCTGVQMENGDLMKADAVIVCTGGQSYISTGSTGDAWDWFRSAGHTVYPPMPSLVGLESPEEWIRRLQGLSLKNVTLTVTSGKKKLYTELGEMLFTHFGISGPLVLSASAYVTEMAPEEYSVALDLKPALREEQLEARILRDVSESPRKQLSSLLQGLFPSRLADEMALLCGIDPAHICAELTKEERSRLIRMTKALPLTISGTRSLNEAIVTRGGIHVREIDPATMESKLIRGLYAAGECLDVDALTGGFNLHIAFSTGYLAGSAAAQE